MKARILIVDDEPAIVDAIQYALETEGFETVCLFSGMPVITALAEHPADLVVLDIGLPDISGLELCREIRRTSAVPIIFLTARADEIDRVVGLELGADDYVTKPFSVKELLARIRAVLRRFQKAEEGEPVQKFKDLVLDRKKHEVTIKKKKVEMTAKEFELLDYLLTHPERVLSRDVLLNNVWGYDYFGTTRTVDVHVRRLREKLGAYGKHIQTVKGYGYLFKSGK
jgi:DNA-binding response OmpR family regulator